MYDLDQVFSMWKSRIAFCTDFKDDITEDLIQVFLGGCSPQSRREYFINQYIDSLIVLRINTKLTVEEMGAFLEDNK